MKLAATLILAASPALAEPMTTATCQDVWSMVEQAIGQPVQAGAPSLTGTGCVIRDIELEPEGEYGAGIKVKSVRFSGGGLSPTDGWLPLSALNLSLDDVRFSPRTPNATMTWLLEQQNVSAGTNLTLDAASVDGAWTIRSLHADFPGNNQIDLTAKANGLDLSSRTQMISSLGWARLTHLDLTFEMEGFFEAYLLMPLGAALLEGADSPDQRVSELKSEAATLIDLLPESSVDGASKSALKDIIADLPHPKGRLELEVVSKQGFGAPNLMSVALNGVGDDPAKTLATVLNGVQITVVWDRAP
jgi:hypothetical protein